MEPEAACDQRAAEQHGVLSRDQALEAGLSARAIDWRLASGRWRALHTGVYVPRPVPSSWHQRMMAAVLCGGPNALASHRSATALRRLDGVEAGMVEISVKAGRKIDGTIVHRRAPHDDPPVEVVSGIPATGIERTLLDLATIVLPKRAGLALDDALRRRLTTLEEIRGMLLRIRPRAGTRRLRELVEARDELDEKLESRLESELLRLLREGGLPRPRSQHRVIDGEDFVARLDFAYPSYRLGIEADGYRWHGSPERWRRDLRRENRLKLLGWTILRFSWDDVHSRPESVAAQIRTALSSPVSLS